MAQVQTIIPEAVSGAKPITVERIKIHGTGLEGNLEGDAVDRDVIVFLPPSYQQQTKRRYPVVYALHGYSIGAEQWTHEIHVPQTIEGAFALGSQEMIVVLPDSKTIYNGSMYSSSQTTGDFERFIYRDVVAYIDAHYRTITDRKSRGLVGHSMGGYGASRIGMKHPDVFGALYIMSPCCLSPMAGGGPGSAPYARAAAWAPDPKNPPLYFDLPTRDGVPQPEVVAKFAANAPLAFVDQYIGNLKQYRAISWTWAIRMVCASMPSSCIRFWITTELRTSLRSTPEPTRVQLQIGFQTMFCHFSPRISALREIASRCLI